VIFLFHQLFLKLLTKTKNQRISSEIVVLVVKRGIRDRGSGIRDQGSGGRTQGKDEEKNQNSETP